MIHNDYRLKIIVVREKLLNTTIFISTVVMIVMFVMIDSDPAYVAEVQVVNVSQSTEQQSKSLIIFDNIIV